MKTTNRTVRNIFPHSCGKNERIDAVAGSMFLSGASFLPVLDENKNVIGTITYLDICMAPSKFEPNRELKVYEVMNSK